MCKDCGAFQTTSRAGSSCQCERDYYNATERVFTCVEEGGVPAQPLLGSLAGWPCLRITAARGEEGRPCIEARDGKVFIAASHGVGAGLWCAYYTE